MRLSPLLLLLVATIPLAAQKAPQPDQGPALTIYNQDFAVIRDHIPLELKSGSNNIQFSGVTARLEPESVMLRDCSAGHTPKILEQTFRPPISQAQMLSMFEGQTIDFQVMRGGEARTVQGKIIRAGHACEPNLPCRFGTGWTYYQPFGQSEPPSNEQPLIQVDGKLQFSLPGTPLFPLPSDPSVLHPQLGWTLQSDTAAATTCELSYISAGMTWEADYNAIAPIKGDTLDLIGWVTLDNRSGKVFENARIKLMAGDINKVQPQAKDYMQFMGGRAGGVIGGVVQPQVTEKSFDEYHLYTIEHPTTLHDGETKQVEFLHRTKVPAKRVYVYSGFTWEPQPGMQYQQEYLMQQRTFGASSQSKVWVMQEIANTEQSGLGMPLPKGRVRFYRQDEGGQLEFIGENTIDHTPRGETLRIYTGNAFDLSGERRRTNFKVDNMQMWADESFEITVKNHRKEPVDVLVLEHLYRGATWDISSKSAPFNKRDSNTIEFPVQVPPDGSQTIIYTVHYTW
jgi:hypothetical protein